MQLKDNQYFLIDLDGVILDTTYDNYFWQKHVPRVYADKHNVSYENAINFTHALFNYKRKTKDWYDIDYWSNMLSIDIKKEKEKSENMKKISLIKGAIEILDKIKNINKDLFLITNAHRKTLNIKMSKYELSKYFNEMICSHELGYVKEDIQFWHILKNKLNIDYKKTVLIEDTFDNIKSAFHAGIKKSIYISNNKNTKEPIKPIIINTLSDLATSL
ncbi:MAG: HAD-IA family hydrolase [Pelagibacterales bacterium]|jgi:putative hydrolase of the HAD superfamily|nr:HAD-IA family hydrolase [Pelagibacterales bacterium]|tara:strand:+ start:357 stop:1007 length:651 start_codon:yes stop_codon:yes gene_type:complete